MEAYTGNGNDTSGNFRIGRDNAPVGNDYTDAPATGTLAAENSSTGADEVSDPVPKMAEIDPKQTDTEHSTGKDFKA